MGKQVEKTFEERLYSLKKGCLILGILQAISVCISISNLINKEGNLLTVIMSCILLAMLYFIYKYTKERNLTGPKLEKIYGYLLLIEGILYCITLVGIILGLICIVLALGIISEAKYFKEAIENGEA